MAASKYRQPSASHIAWRQGGAVLGVAQVHWGREDGVVRRNARAPDSCVKPRSGRWKRCEHLADATRPQSAIDLSICTGIGTLFDRLGGKYLANVRTGVSDTVYGKVSGVKERTMVNATRMRAKNRRECAYCRCQHQERECRVRSPSAIIASKSRCVNVPGEKSKVTESVRYRAGRGAGHKPAVGYELFAAAAAAGLIRSRERRRRGRAIRISLSSYTSLGGHARGQYDVLCAQQAGREATHL